LAIAILLVVYACRDSQVELTWVGLHTEMVYLSTDGYLSQY